MTIRIEIQNVEQLHVTLVSGDDDTDLDDEVASFIDVVADLSAAQR